MSTALRRQCLQGTIHCFARDDEIPDQSLVHVEIALVLTLVSYVVAFREHAPNLRAKPEGVRKHLKDDVPILGAIAPTPQGRHA
jgi:hypothetical protein